MHTNIRRTPGISTYINRHKTDITNIYTLKIKLSTVRELFPWESWLIRSPHTRKILGSNPSGDIFFAFSNFLTSTTLRQNPEYTFPPIQPTHEGARIHKYLNQEQQQVTIRIPDVMYGISSTKCTWNPRSYIRKRVMKDDELAKEQFRNIECLDQSNIKNQKYIQQSKIKHQISQLIDINTHKSLLPLLVSAPSHHSTPLCNVVTTRTSFEIVCTWRKWRK